MPPFNVLLLTQNLGSIECNTEELSPTNKTWTDQWIQSVAAFAAETDVLVLHLQELGGKKYNRAFLDYLKSQIPKCHAGWCSGLLGPTENDVATFTAMGTVLFLSPRVAPSASIWSFETKEFVPSTGGPKFFYSSAKFLNAGTSRKGYLLTRLRLADTVLNFCNLHLFHDADNTVAASQFHPSEYAAKRADGMAEALKEISGGALFVFGDFNLRLDTHLLKARLEETCGESIQLEKKKIHAPPSVWDHLHTSQNWPTLRTELDKDAAFVQTSVQDKTGISLEELTVQFGPTYLLEDDPAKARSNTLNDGGDSDDVALKACYQTSRFPAWCDRVWYNSEGGALLNKESDATYWTAPLHPMDHLAVYLRFFIDVTSEALE